MKIGLENGSNTVGGGAQTLGYDHDSRVISVTNSSVTETYTYNHRNQRVSRTAGGQTDYYLYGAVGEMVGRYRSRTYNMPEGGGTIQALSCEEKFFYLGGRLLKKQDRLGSTSSFYPYGEDKAESVAGGSFRFATYWRDGGGTGLDYARNRYYSATYGRFTSADPLDDSASPTNSQSWNRFAYVQGDPANLLDSDGLGPINAQSCEDAKRMAQQAGGQANFACPAVSFSVTVTARPGGSGFNPGYVHGPGGMPGSIFDAHRPPVPTGPPAGTPTGGGEGQSEAECLNTVFEGERQARQEFLTSLETTFTPVNSANATAIKAAIGSAIAGARGAVAAEVLGLAGAALGGFVGYVIGFSTAVISGPVVDPMLMFALTWAFDSVNAGVSRTLAGYCMGATPPTVWDVLEVPRSLYDAGHAGRGSRARASGSGRGGW